MDITPLIPEGKKHITRYGTGFFQVNTTRYTTSLYVLPDTIIPWQVLSFSEITEASFLPLLPHSHSFELLLLGTGKEHMPLPTTLYRFFKEKAIAVESMGTGAACRTYNVLLAEGRRMAAALIVL